ncbi:MAG: hypothetical protein KDA99_18490, partial [Planctomycetales bacterium]|nr:hypothetical protein [Planctomycetales bacterium]
PVANGTSVPLLLLTIGILGLASMGRSTSWLQVAVRAVVTGVVIVACVLLVTRMGGVFARGADYGRDGFHLSITSYGIKNYLVFIAGYLLLMAPVGVVGVWLAIRQVWMRRWRLFELDHGMLVTLAACLVLYPLPLLLSLQRSVWNDFSKFNYFGVLASWILIGWCWDRATRSILKVGWGRAFAVALLVLVCSETGLNWMHGVWDDEQQQYLASVDARSELRQTLIRDIPIDAQVVLVTKRLDGYYEWSEGDFPRLYRFLRDNYGDFTTSIKESGASVPNYFSFTLSYNPARERQLWEVLDGLHRGRPEKLGDWNIAYVLFNVGDAPQYVEALLRSGKLQVVAESSSEGWQLCRVERCKSEMPTADQKDRGVSPQLVGGLP